MIDTAPEIVLRVNQLMVKSFEIPAEKLQPGATLVDDLGLDSLDAVDMLVFLEEVFGIKVEGERLAAAKTLSDVYVLTQETLTLKLKAGHA